MLYRLRQWLRQTKAEMGHATFGRLPEQPRGHVDVPVEATLTVRVFRQDGEVEEIGTFPARIQDHGNSSD